MDSKLPKAVEEAVDQIIAEMSLEEKAAVARFSEKELAALKDALMVYIRERLVDSGINEALKEACIKKAGGDLSEMEAPTVIMDELWKTLKKTHALKLV